MTEKRYTVWHFAPLKDGRPVMRYTGEPIEPGHVYDCGTDPRLCHAGYHGSTDLLDAIDHAPGPYLSRRVIWGDVQVGDDKLCGRYCEHQPGADMTEVLRRFARVCALDVIHLWDAPKIVVRYLRTGDETLRAAARAAPCVVAGDATKAAAKSAARSAARSAAWAAAWDAAWAAARDAARAAAWDAARTTAWVAFKTTAWVATRDAARANQRRRLAAMVGAEFKRTQEAGQ